MAYPNYAITRIEEYLAALADGSAAEKAVLASAIEEGGLGWITPETVVYQNDSVTGEEIIVDELPVELVGGETLTLIFKIGNADPVEASAVVDDDGEFLIAYFEIDAEQAVVLENDYAIEQKRIAFNIALDGAAFTITQPAVVHMIDSDFLPIPTPSVMILNATRKVFDNPVSYNDIRTAVDAGKVVLLYNMSVENIKAIFYLSSIYIDSEDDQYTVEFGDGDILYKAASADAPLQES